MIDSFGLSVSLGGAAMKGKLWPGALAGVCKGCCGTIDIVVSSRACLPWICIVSEALRCGFELGHEAGPDAFWRSLSRPQGLRWDRIGQVPIESVFEHSLKYCSWEASLESIQVPESGDRSSSGHGEG